MIWPAASLSLLLGEFFMNAEEFVPDPVTPFGNRQVGFDYCWVMLFHVYFQDAVDPIFVFLDLYALNCLHSHTGTSK
jgi:hypothetical protein